MFWNSTQEMTLRPTATTTERRSHHVGMMAPKAMSANRLARARAIVKPWCTTRMAMCRRSGPAIGVLPPPGSPRDGSGHQVSRQEGPEPQPDKAGRAEPGGAFCHRSVSSLARVRGPKNHGGDRIEQRRARCPTQRVRVILQTPPTPRRSTRPRATRQRTRPVPSATSGARRCRGRAAPG